jgi:hypothetical protein
LGIPLPFTGEFEEVIMIEVAIEERWLGRTEFLNPKRIAASLRLVLANLNQSEMALKSTPIAAVCLKTS